MRQLKTLRGILNALKVEGASAYQFAVDELKSNRGVIMEALNHTDESIYGWNATKLYQAIPDEFKKDKEITKIAVSKSSDALKYAPNEMKNDVEVVNSNLLSLKYASFELKNDKALAKKAITETSYLSLIANTNLVKDYDFIYDTLKNTKDLSVYDYTVLDEKLAKDRDICCEFLKHIKYYNDYNFYELNSSIISNIPDDILESDKELNLLISQNSQKYFNELLPDAFREDGPFLTELINTAPWITERYVYNCYMLYPEKFHDDKDFTLNLVKKAPQALHHSSPRLKNDFQVVDAAVSADGSILCYASDAMKNNETIVSLAVSNYGKSIRYASQRLLENPDIIKVALNQNGEAIEYLNDNDKHNIDYVKLAINNTAKAFFKIPEEFFDNKEIVLLAIDKSDDGSNNMAYLISPRLMADKDVAMAAYKKLPYAYDYIDASLKYCDKNFIIDAYNNDKGLNVDYKNLAYSIKSDIDVVMAAFNSKHNITMYMPKVLKDNEKVILEAINRFGAHELNNASPRLIEKLKPLLEKYSASELLEQLDNSKTTIKELNKTSGPNSLDSLIAAASVNKKESSKDLKVKDNLNL